MDATILARIQFAFTAGFHFLFPPLTIGMAWILVVFMGRWKKTGEEFWRETARFWTKLFTVSFAVGVATGLTMEFQFGMNWADYSRFVGDIFGAPLAAEGIFSFFLESTFLGVLIFGWNRFSPKMLWFASLMVAVGSTLSALWIIIANSWMQTPAGFEIMGNRAVLTDFFAAALNPSTLPRYLHTINAALMTGAFFVVGVSAWYLIKKRHFRFASESLKLGLIVAVLATIGQLLNGHYSAVQVTYTQPEKLAAMEGQFETQKGAGLFLFGLPDAEAEKTHFRVEIPKALSLLATGDPNAEIKGLKAFPKEDRPPVLATFASFHIMVGLWSLFAAYVAVGLYLMKKGRLYDQPLFLKASVAMVPLPFIANEFGWMAAEVGRQPWAVYQVIRTKDAVSTNVSAGEILFSLLVYAAVYGLLFFLWTYLLRKLIRKGPALDDAQGKEVTS